MAGTTWTHLEKFPPPYVRLLAKRRGGGTSDMAIPDAEIAVRADMEIDRVREISRSSSWDEIPLGELRRFLIACDFDPTNADDRQRVSVYESICTKRNTVPFHYLRRSPKWESEFLPLVRMLPQILSPDSSLRPRTREAISHARTSPTS